MRKNFGEILKATRTAQYLSINQLSEASGVSAAHISRLENELRDVPKPDTIKKLTTVLGNYKELMVAAGYISLDHKRPELQSAREVLESIKEEEAPARDYNSCSLPAREKTAIYSPDDQYSVPEGARKIIDSLARAQDLNDEDFDVIADQVERLIAYAKKKTNTPTGR